MVWTPSVSRPSTYRRYHTSDGVVVGVLGTPVRNGVLCTLVLWSTPTSTSMQVESSVQLLAMVASIHGGGCTHSCSTSPTEVRYSDGVSIGSSIPQHLVDLRVLVGPHCTSHHVLLLSEEQTGAIHMLCSWSMQVCLYLSV